MTTVYIYVIHGEETGRGGENGVGGFPKFGEIKKSLTYRSSVLLKNSKYNEKHNKNYTEQKLLLVRDSGIS